MIFNTNKQVNSVPFCVQFSLDFTFLIVHMVPSHLANSQNLLGVSQDMSFCRKKQSKRIVVFSCQRTTEPISIYFSHSNSFTIVHLQVTYYIHLHCKYVFHLLSSLYNMEFLRINSYKKHCNKKKICTYQLKYDKMHFIFSYSLNIDAL